MMVLGDEDGQEMMAGARLVARKDQFYPTPARLLDAALAVRHGEIEMPDKHGMWLVRSKERDANPTARDIAFQHALDKMFDKQR